MGLLFWFNWKQNLINRYADMDGLMADGDLMAGISICIFGSCKSLFDFRAHIRQTVFQQGNKLDVIVDE